MPPDYCLAKEVTSITRPKSCSLPRSGNLKVVSQSTALNSGSSVGKGFFPGEGNFLFQVIIDPKLMSFMQGDLLPLLCCLLLSMCQVMQAQLIVSGENKRDN